MAASLLTLAASPEFIRHPGMASASAVVPVGTDHFLAASDEDNRLRLYPIKDGPAILDFDVSGWMRLRGRQSEIDLEGAANLGELTFWLGSHGRAKDGRIRPNRERLFATQIVTNNDRPQIRVVGQPYWNLLKDLLAAPQLGQLNLSDAANRAPDEGGINLEGLAAAPNGELLISFRSPVPGGRALLVPLKNPREIIDGRPAQLGEPILLDLGKLGIRDLAWSGREWFCLAGRSGAGGNAQLFRWQPGETRAHRIRIDHTGFKQANPEALAVFGPPESPRLLVLSDDGKMNRSQFRSFWAAP